MSAPGLMGKKFVGIVKKELDPDGRGRYYVNIPELQPHMPESTGILCTNSTGGSRTTNSGSGTYGGSCPLQKETQVQVEFYSDDINSGRITAIVSDDQPNSDMSPGRVVKMEPSGKVIQVAVSGIPEMITSLQDSVQAQITKLLNSGNAIAQGLLGTIAGKLGDVFKEIQNGFQTLADGALDKIQKTIAENLPKLECLNNIKNTIVNSISNLDISKKISEAINISNINLSGITEFIKENANVAIALGETALTTLAASQLIMNNIGESSENIEDKIDNLKEYQNKNDLTYEDLDSIKQLIEETQSNINEMQLNVDESQKNLELFKINIEENKDKLSEEEKEQLYLQIDIIQQDINNMVQQIKESQEIVDQMKKSIGLEVDKLHGITVEQEQNNTPENNTPENNIAFMPMMISDSPQISSGSGDILGSLGSFGGVQIPHLSLDVFDVKAAEETFKQLENKAKKFVNIPTDIIKNAVKGIEGVVVNVQQTTTNVKEFLGNISNPKIYAKVANNIKNAMNNLPGVKELGEMKDKILDIASGTMNKAQFIANEMTEWGKKNANKIHNIFTNVNSNTESSNNTKVALASGKSSSNNSSNSNDESPIPKKANTEFGKATAQGNERDKRHLLHKTPNGTAIYINEDTENDPNSLYVAFKEKESVLRVDESGFHFSTQKNKRERILVNNDIEINGSSSIMVTGGNYDIYVNGLTQIYSTGQIRMFSDDDINIESKKNINICAHEGLSLEGSNIGTSLSSTKGFVYVGSKKWMYHYSEDNMFNYTTKNFGVNAKGDIGHKAQRKNLVEGSAGVYLNSNKCSNLPSMPPKWIPDPKADPFKRGVCAV